MTILSALHHGRASARTKKYIATELGISTREVEEAIQKARLEGAPIISCDAGYYLGTAAEAKSCADRLRARAIHQMETAQALSKTAERLAFDGTLFGDAA